MDIVNFVVQPTWKEMLTQLVASEQMDPWDIDVGMVATKYMEKLKEMEALDLRVPANVILAASLLLRFKADDLWVAEEEEAYEEPILQDEVLPELVFRANRPRRRTVTLEELVSSLEQVIKKGKKQSYSSKSFLPALLFEVPKEEMDQRMEYVFNQISELKDAEGIARFTELLQEKNMEQVAKYLLPVLHLVQEHRIYAWQDSFFGDIFLKHAELAVAEAKEQNKEKN